jgi:hypothetical protein
MQRKLLFCNKYFWKSSQPINLYFVAYSRSEILNSYITLFNDERSGAHTYH